MLVRRLSKSAINIHMHGCTQYEEAVKGHGGSSEKALHICSNYYMPSVGLPIRITIIGNILCHSGLPRWEVQVTNRKIFWCHYLCKLGKLVTIIMNGGNNLQGLLGVADVYKIFGTNF